MLGIQPIIEKLKNNSNAVLDRYVYGTAQLWNKPHLDIYVLII